MKPVITILAVSMFLLSIQADAGWRGRETKAAAKNAEAITSCVQIKLEITAQLTTMESPLYGPQAGVWKRIAAIHHSALVGRGIELDCWPEKETTAQ